MAGEAQAAIASLKAAGWSYNAIANFVGRDVSLISQIARGAKPGANLAPALEGLAASGRSPMQAALVGAPAIPRRAQRVREGVQRLGAGPTERQAIHRTSGGNEDIKRTLREAAREGKQVQFTGDFSNVKRKRKSPTAGKRARGRAPAGKGLQQKRGEVPIYQKGGYDAQKALDRIEHPGPGDPWKAGDAKGFLRAEAQRMGNIEHVGRFNKVEIHAYNPS